MTRCSINHEHSAFLTFCCMNATLDFGILAFLRLFQREEPFLISPHSTFPHPISTLSLTHRSTHIVSQRKRVLIPRYYLKNISVCVMYCAYVLMCTPQHGCRRAMVGVGPSLLPCSRQGLSFCHCFIYTRLADPSVSGAVFCFNLLSYNRSVATADMCYLVLLHGLWESKLSSSGCWQELSPPGTSLLHIRQ